MDVGQVHDLFTANATPEEKAGTETEILDVSALGQDAVGFKIVRGFPPLRFEMNMIFFAQGRLSIQVLLIGPHVEQDDSMALAKVIADRAAALNP
jgi:hypothetical protein